ncbi:hypothetical protein Pla22_13730 [Rubripirellula amarantea]|uniref:Uncharacterized protein n=1 Tax=Rubripirellula amarantea TaxID=2527999 RepID=A0A5C5WUH8_9BACT|nr:hypothetical protein Pla22_13730 [Rubripirellula amarantea]
MNYRFRVRQGSEHLGVCPDWPQCSPMAVFTDGRVHRWLCSPMAVSNLVANRRRTSRRRTRKANVHYQSCAFRRRGIHPWVFNVGKEHESADKNHKVGDSETAFYRELVLGGWRAPQNRRISRKTLAKNACLGPFPLAQLKTSRHTVRPPRNPWVTNGNAIVACWPDTALDRSGWTANRLATAPPLNVSAATISWCGKELFYGSLYRPKSTC